jgi:hypothetical protein
LTIAKPGVEQILSNFDHRPLSEPAIMSLSTSTLITAALLGLILNAGTLIQIDADGPVFGDRDAGVTSAS